MGLPRAVSLLILTSVMPTIDRSQTVKLSEGKGCYFYGSFNSNFDPRPGDWMLGFIIALNQLLLRVMLVDSFVSTFVVRNRRTNLVIVALLILTCQ